MQKINEIRNVNNLLNILFSVCTESSVFAIRTLMWLFTYKVGVDLRCFMWLKVNNKGACNLLYHLGQL